MDRFPRIRLYDADGLLDLREGLLMCFFMRRPHGEISAAVNHALDIYLDAVGVGKLGWYLDMRGEYDPEEHKDVTAELRPLDRIGWARVREDLKSLSQCVLQLEEHPNQVGGYHVEYHGRLPSTIENPRSPDVVSAVSFWLPTEYLEEQGASRVRTLAMDMARALPFDSGYVSLAFNYLARFRDVIRMVHERCFLHPGLDIHDVRHTSNVLGGRIRGVHWLNFYAQPLLGQLDGVERLRERLGSFSVSVEEFDEDKAVVSLGEWPVTEGPGLEPYCALARVLEPSLYEEPQRRWFGFSQEQLQRWQRRFLDG